MFRRRLYSSVLLSFFVIISLLPQDNIVPKFDPFLQQKLSERGHIEWLREARPEVPSTELSKIQTEVERIYHFVLHGDDAAFDQLGLQYNTRINGIATARVNLSDLLRAGHHPGIRLIEKGGPMTTQLDQSIPDIRVNQVHNGVIMNTPFKGEGVILGIIDTGIDIFHKDFRYTDDEFRSRVISIWDVELEPRAGERSPDGKDYGVEYTREEIERELRGQTQGAIRARDRNGHGTHVAGIAGGNGASANGRYTGVAPGAEFVIVAFPGGSFPVVRVIDAIDYIFSIADELQRPAVINLSIGGHFGAHDGTSGHEMVITEFARQPGKAVAVAAGNSGSQPIHFAATVNPDEASEFVIRVPDYTPGSSNDFILKMLWYESDDTVEVTVTSPNGKKVTARSGESILESTSDGTVELETFNGFTNPRGARTFVIDIHRADAPSSIPPVAGDWTVTVRNLSNESSMRFNSWFITASMNNVEVIPNSGRRYTVTMPGTAEGAITAGAYTTRTQWVNRDGNSFQIGGAVFGQLAAFSGSGPTRDGRRKPNISAPGQIIGAAKSNDANFHASLLLPGTGYALLQGTSMASPHIAGLAAIILQANNDLTGMEVIEILEQSGRSDNSTGSVPNEIWGFGKADAIAMFDFFEVLHGIPAIPEKIALVSTEDGAENVGLRPEFTWQSSAFSQYYEFQLSTNIEFTDLIISETGLTDTTYVVTQNLIHNTLYYWRVRAINPRGAGEWSEVFTFTSIPDRFVLFQNYPNPFNNSTTIEFTIPQPTYGKLVVYDVLGREVDVIIEDNFEPRQYIEIYNASRLSSGVYYYRLETDEYVDVQKMILLR